MSQAKTYAISDPAAVAAKVKAAGGPALDPTQAKGRASADGVTVGWSMCSGELTITILQKPWMVPYDAIWSHIDAVLG
ncbi:MAG: hypothetical protein WBY53_04145 [Acidobacteriaceae bacterium]